MTREVQGRPTGRLIRAMWRVTPRFVPVLHSGLYRMFNGGLGTEKMTLGAPVLLLTTRGRRTGRPRSVPVGHVVVDGHPIVAGTNGGLEPQPDWVHNPRADPRCIVQIRGERFAAAADFLDGEQYEPHWDRLAESYRIYDQARSLLRRRIPLVRLRRIESPGSSR